MTITAKRLREVLRFDLHSGYFVWIAKRGRSGFGKIAGSPDRDGYIVIGIDRQRYKAHRLAWLWRFGALPSGDLDHVDCDKTNNRIENLRLATHSENRCNVRRQVVNTSGFKGVHYNKHAKRWRAIVKAKGECFFLGYFDTPQQAHAAYSKTASALHGEFARVE